MVNQYFKKDKKVKLITTHKEKSPGSFPVTTYQYITNQALWAYTRQLSQDQIFQARTYGDNETRLFVLNYRNDLKVYDFIEYKEKYYSITRLDTTDDYNGELFVYVKDAAMGDTPRDVQPAAN